MEFRVRVSALVFDGESILLVRHGNYWVLPGGGLELGETVKECVERELLEETKLEVGFGRIVFIGDFIQEDRHYLDVFVLCSRERGMLMKGDDPKVKDVKFVPLEELRLLDVKPPLIVEKIIAHHPDFDCDVYLGSY
jgi:ADP-ribose pyrophosphatase YjhB (NUDIX family)